MQIQQKPSKPGIRLDEMVGRTVAAVEEGTIEGQYGDEPTITLRFTDGTFHTFVLPIDEDT